MPRAARTAVPQSLPPQAVPSAFRPRTPGRPLDAPTREVMEEHFHHDFTRVRIHDDDDAARSLGAHAFTAGQDVVFAAGRFTVPRLRHELAHVIQQSRGVVPGMSAPGDVHERDAERIAAGGAPRLGVLPPAVMRDAVVPTMEQRERLMPIYNPEGSSASQLDDPAGFRTEMAAELAPHIARIAGAARNRQSSTLELSRPDVQSLSSIAVQAIQSAFGSYLPGGGGTPAATAAMEQSLASRIHLVSDSTESAERIACNWVVNIMENYGRSIIDTHNVVASSDVAKRNCSDQGPGAVPTGALPADQRDQVLYESVRNAIYTAHLADLLVIARFGPSFSEGEGAWIQTRLGTDSSLSTDDIFRRGRWSALGTILHEVLHTTAHASFRTAFGQVEQTEVGVEGFAEYFARQAYSRLRGDAAGSETVRLAIEGGRGSAFSSSVIPERRGYQTYVDDVERIRAIVDEENLRLAYFRGQMEYLGLGSWSQPPNQFGAGIYIDVDSTQQAALFRVHYGRIVAGHTSRWQLQVGADATYLTAGSRLGIGGDITLSYSWPNVFVSAGVLTQASTDVTRPIDQTIRLDVIPHLDAGVRIGIVRVGAGGVVLVPTAAGPMADRRVRVMGLLGASVEF